MREPYIFLQNRMCCHTPETEPVTGRHDSFDVDIGIAKELVVYCAIRAIFSRNMLPSVLSRIAGVCNGFEVTSFGCC